MKSYSKSNFFVILIVFSLLLSSFAFYQYIKRGDTRLSETEVLALRELTVMQHGECYFQTVEFIGPHYISLTLHYDKSVDSEQLNGFLKASIPHLQKIGSLDIYFAKDRLAEVMLLSFESLKNIERIQYTGYSTTEFEESFSASCAKNGWEEVSTKKHGYDFRVTPSFRVYKDKDGRRRENLGWFGRLREDLGF